MALSAGIGANVAMAPSPTVADTLFGVAAFSDVNFGGEGTLITSDQPDLQTFGDGWANRISSLQVHDGMAIAVYSQPNYAGTCDTFVGSDPSLFDDAIGNDQIVSMRLNHNCLGEVRRPVLSDDMTVITGQSSRIQCPTGYVKSQTDLNEGAGGDFIYACSRYKGATLGSFAGTQMDFHVLNYLAKSPSSRSFDCEQAGGRLIDVDLNQGTGLGSEYFCVTTGFEGLQFLSMDASETAANLLVSQIRQKCTSLFPDSPPASNIVLDDQPNAPIDLNSHAGGNTIYSCVLVQQYPSSKDFTAPIITFDGSNPAANANGWNNTPVTLNWTCSDSDSGPMTPGISQLVTTEGNSQSVTGTCQDLDGNRGHDTQTVNIDEGAPSIAFVTTSGMNSDGWSNGNVAVSWNCSDRLSGPLSPVLLQLITTEGSNQSATGTCSDLAGNTAANTVNGINIDRTPPTIALQTRTAPNAAGWNNSSVVVVWSCADSVSGVRSTSEEQKLTGEGSNQSLTGTCTDLAGNSVDNTVQGIKIDETAPSTMATPSPALNANGWSKSPVDVALSATDNLSGTARTEFNLDGGGWTPYTGAPVSITSDGSHRLLYRSFDVAGNEEPQRTLTVKIDTAAPEALLEFDPATKDIVVHATDAGSGVASGAVPASSVVTANGGQQLRTYVLTDLAGNTLQLQVRDRNNDHALEASIVSLQYNAGAANAVSDNALQAEWRTQAGGILAEAEQHVRVNAAGSQQVLDAEFRSDGNQTIVESQINGAQQRQVRTGFLPLTLSTSAGALTAGS